MSKFSNKTPSHFNPIFIPVKPLEIPISNLKNEENRYEANTLKIRLY